MTGNLCTKGQKSTCKLLTVIRSVCLKCMWRFCCHNSIKNIMTFLNTFFSKSISRNAKHTDFYALCIKEINTICCSFCSLSLHWKIHWKLTAIHWAQHFQQWSWAIGINNCLERSDSWTTGHFPHVHVFQMHPYWPLMITFRYSEVYNTQLPFYTQSVNVTILQLICEQLDI